MSDNRWQRPMLLVVAGLALWVALLWLGLALCQWDHAYTLDDAWIHLQFAEQLANGHLGLQPGVSCMPCSSLFWPLLLVPFAGSALMPMIPLMLDLVFLLAGLWVLGRLLFPTDGTARVRPATALVVLATSNLVGLAHTGMEHGLQLLVALGLVAVMHERGTGTGKRREGLFLLLCLAGPLVRYELLALVLPAILLDPAPGIRPVARLTRLAAALLPLAAFSLWLHGQGLGWLPSSLAAKSDLASASGALSALKALVANGVHNLQLPQGRVLAGVVALLLVCTRLESCTPVTRRLALWMALATSLHLAAGRTGWLDRYEIQVWLPSVIVLVRALAEADPVSRLGLPRRTAALCGWALLVLAGLPYLRTTLTTPWAMANIHQQQQQLARFVREFWQAPVAVNDIGCVTWRNPWPVLDLWGLSSPRALAARRADPGGDWADRLAREQGVGLVMVYTQWFETLPAHWIPLGSLHLGGPRVSSDQEAVAFFALDHESRRRAHEALAAFVPGLPPGVEFRPAPVTRNP